MEDDLLSQQRFRVFRITTVFGIAVFSTSILQTFLADFSHPILLTFSVILFVGIFINYFVLPMHKNVRTAYMILLILAFLVVHMGTYFTGGIHSSTIFYLFDLILIAFMLLGKNGGQIMAGISVVHVVYFYFAGVYTNWIDYSLLGTGAHMIELDFLITGVFSILLLTAQANYIEKSKNAIINDIKLKRDELAINNAALLNTRNDLELRNKELKQKNAELEQFAFISSHDLQEPLRTISDFVGLLQQQYVGKLDEKADKYLSFIAQSSKRMRTLIKDLLHYSQIGNEKINEPVDCAALLHEVKTNIGKIIAEKRAEIHSDPLPVITGNATGIKQLFQNLVINAIKFRKKDSIPEIKISAKKKGAYWEFSFTDNGIGIEQQHSQRIFDIFKRLHPRTEYTGSGIGLSHCKKIVELHGGKIWVKSEPEAGSTFYFTILA